MSLGELLLFNFLMAAGIMVAAWIVHLIQGKASVVDSFWGPGFAAIAWSTFAWTEGDRTRKTLLAVLVTIWALRLALHLIRRNWGKPEDPRYADMRAKHPDIFWISSLFTVFLLQALLMWFISLPVQLGMRGDSTAGLTVLDWIGLLLWCFGFFWEAVGDEQLYRFKSNPSNKGKIMDKGLWRYTRHPNYFGEAVMWWAIFLIACSAEGGWWSFIGPLILTLLLLKVSGVTLTEKKMHEGHSDYDEYKRRTSTFLPLPPKEASK